MSSVRRGNLGPRGVRTGEDLKRAPGDRAGVIRFREVQGGQAVGVKHDGGRAPIAHEHTGQFRRVAAASQAVADHGQGHRCLGREGQGGAGAIDGTNNAKST